MSNQLRNKMHDYEITPPHGLWDKIETTLSEKEQTTELSTKLFDLEVTPPPLAWQQIKNVLEKDPEAPVSKSKKISYLSYAAAAVIIALMIFGGIRLINTDSVKKEITVNKNTTLTKDPAAPSNHTTASATSLNNSIEADEIRDDAALEESKRTIAKNDFTISTKLKLARESYLSAPAHYIDNAADVTNNYPNLHYSAMLQPLFANASSTEDLSDRYIMLKTPDGNFFRMSKKLADLICCISGEDQDENCKDQLQRWREKIACSPLAPSPGNFMDILNLIASLQDDKN
ncbi:MAG TPA: hypothetical protein VHD35_04955 [Chitinophagaceae bacterium]|nr:hypothetical protein [Chitinophagaceae bacterium]